MGSVPLRNRWFADSPLEGTGFEPSVPREKEPPFETTLIDLGPVLLLGKQPSSPEGSGVRIPLSLRHIPLASTNYHGHSVARSSGSRIGGNVKSGCLWFSHSMTRDGQTGRGVVVLVHRDVEPDLVAKRELVQVAV